MKFNFIDIDKSVLPTAKGKRTGKYRFYDINGTNYPSVTSILGVRKKIELQQWRDRIGDDVAINQLTGTISGRAFSQSLLNTVTPIIIALG